jgi:EAL domain-containing protein (putative c-di-GMP-specific phosphodiesterase class I)
VRQFVQLPDGEAMRMDVSGGIAIAPQHGNQIEALLRRADAALQASKRAGRGRALVFEPAHDQKHEAKLAMEAALQRAIREDALHVHFQRQFDARTGVLRGAEALVRWNDPRLGSVSPAAFIPLAEEMGVMNDIALLVLRRAVAVAAHPRVPHVAVNLSATQFRQNGFIEAAREVLRCAGVGPERIEFEVTESVLAEDQDEVMARFDTLRAAGFTLALDDFGTGFSSLSYLRRFRFDRLKIDRSFVRDLGRDPQARALAGSIVALGHGLGLEVVGEGVETFEQLRALRELGCDTVQGFLSGRPMPAEEFMALVSGTPPLPTRPRVIDAASAGA